MVLNDFHMVPYDYEMVQNYCQMVPNDFQMACHELSKNTQFVYIEWNLPTPFFDWNFGWNRPFSNTKKPKFFQQKSQKFKKWHKIIKNDHSTKI